MPVTICNSREEAQSLYVPKCNTGRYVPTLFVETVPGKWSRTNGWVRRIEGKVLAMNQAPRALEVEVFAFPMPEEGRRAHLFVGLYPLPDA